MLQEDPEGIECGREVLRERMVEMRTHSRARVRIVLMHLTSASLGVKVIMGEGCAKAGGDWSEGER